jgi:hypothetical protein
MNHDGQQQLRLLRGRIGRGSEAWASRWPVQAGNFCPLAFAYCLLFFSLRASGPEPLATDSYTRPPPH